MATGVVVAVPGSINGPFWPHPALNPVPAAITDQASRAAGRHARPALRVRPALHVRQALHVGQALHARRGGWLDTLDFNFIAGILSTMTSANAPVVLPTTASTSPPATPSVTPPATPLSDAEFHRLAHAVLAQVEATVDRWLDDDVIDIDSQRTGGLLELSLPGGSKIILNTQPPLQELWLAAKAGGHHYRHVAGHWLDTRDGSEFFAALSQHTRAQAGQAGQALVFSAS